MKGKPMTGRDTQIANAIWGTLVSPNEMDRNMEAANIVDGLFAIARAIRTHAASLDHFTKALSEKDREKKSSL